MISDDSKPAVLVPDALTATLFNSGNAHMKDIGIPYYASRAVTDTLAQIKATYAL